MEPTPSEQREEEVEEEVEKESEEVSDGCDESDQESLGDDDRDFDFGGHTAQKDLQGLMLTEGTYVRCNWIDPEEEEKRVNTWQKDKKAKVDPESEETALTGLQAAASTCTHFQLRGPRYPERWQETKEQEASQKAFRIMRAISDSLINRLMVLRIDNFPGSGDPVFGTKHELRRSLRAPDLFGKLTTAFQAGTRCCLKRVTLQGGFHSAASVANFLRVAKPPLESFRCRGCLFHGRNFEMLVKALSGACAGTLLEFETDAAIGGRDPFGFLADSFPQLRMLRAKCVFGKTENLEALKRLNLKKKLCKLPKEDHRLRGRPAVNTKRGVVYWFISSDHHDDGYRGQGLWWDELDNTCECMEEWRVGKGVTQKKCLTFMEECGIDLDPQLSDEDCGMDSDTGSADSVPDGEQDIVWNRLDTVVVQLEVDDSTSSTVAIRARTMDGRQFAQVTVDTGTTLMRTLLEELASKYPCSPLSMRLVLPNGSCTDALASSTQPLGAILKGA